MDSSRPACSVISMVAENKGHHATSSRAGAPRKVGSTTTSTRRASNMLGTNNKNTYQRNMPSRRHRNSSKHSPIATSWRHKHPIIFWFLIIIFTPILLGLALFLWMYATTEIPQPDKIAMAEKTKVFYADGKTEIGSYAEQNREIIDCKILPQYVSKAIVASENRSFYEDKGIDFKGIARALINNITRGTRQGGSTITQQYAERYYLGETKSYLGKLHEAVLALKIAQQQDKNTVLCNYMNTIYLGRGAYGIQAAAKAYFGTDAKNLTLNQAALLAGIIPAPSSWDPNVGPQEASIRYKRVLRIMKEDGYINADQASKAIRDGVPKTIKQTSRNVYAGPRGYLLDMVRRELTERGTFTKEDLDTGGYRIITTIDKAKQDAMFNVASPTAGGNGIVPQGLQIGGISINAKNGSIIAMYAGDDYLTKPLNNATQALYEPGSTMKPFALMAAIQAGTSLSTLFNGNSPQKFVGIEKPVSNFANTNYGMIDLYRATAHSVNTTYMALQEKLGAPAVAQVAVKAGMNPKRINGRNPFTVLGNDSVHVSEIARAYATFANQGKLPNLHIVASVKNSDNKEFYRAPTEGKQVFSANDAALAAKAMLGTVQYGTATQARYLGRPIAGKSGTANDQTAGSFVGFTPSVVTVFAMWYPNAQGNPQVVPSFRGYSGGSDYPVNLFTKYMRQALANTPIEKFPEAKDTGKVGGTDGTWGLGARTQSMIDEEKKKEKEKDEEKDEKNEDEDSHESEDNNSLDSHGDSRKQDDQGNTTEGREKHPGTATGE